MKTSFIVLIILGLLAAASAAALTASIGSRGRPGAQAEPTARVLVAARGIEPMTVLDQAMVAVREVPRKQAPAGAYGDPVQVVGRIVSTPLAQGQAVMPANFAPRGAGLELATQLGPGMRAVTVSLNVPSSLKGLLYPGSVVDVLVSFRLQSANSALGEAVATTLLENIQILAVDNQLVSNPEEPAAVEVKNSRPAAGNNQCLVTFKVDPRQAEALQLATEYGKVSLALRNPSDRVPIDADATLLSQGKLAGMADLLNAMIASRNKKPAVEPAPAPTPVVIVEKKAEPARPRGWQVEVYRGVAREVVSIPAR